MSTLNVNNIQHVSGDQVTVTSNLNVSGNLIVSGTLNAKVTDFVVSADLTTIGDAASDAVTFNARDIAIPNNINFNSNTLHISASSRTVGIGVEPSSLSTASKLQVNSTGSQQKWSYDAASFATIAVANDSHTTLATGETGNIILDAAGVLKLDSNTGDISLDAGGTAQLAVDMDGSAGQVDIQIKVDSDDLVFKQYDGNEVIRIADDRKLYFFDQGGEHISSDGSDLTIGAGSDINLTATTDINIPANVGLTFGHATADKIEGNGSGITVTSQALTLDVAGNITLDADGGSVTIADGAAGTIGTLLNDSTKLHLSSSQTGGGLVLSAGNQNTDIVFKGNDAGTAVTALTLDMSESGDATFNNDIKVTGDIILDDGGSLKEAGGVAAITFDGSGHVTKIGQDSPSSADVLTYDGSKWVAEAPTTGDITGVAAGVGLSGGGTSGDVTLTLDLSELSDVTPVNGDKLATLDSDGSTEQLTTVANLATLFAGTGLTAASSVIGVDASQSQITTLAGLTAAGTAGSDLALSYDTITVSDPNAGEPQLILKTTATTKESSSELRFVKDGADTEDGEFLGQITFYGEDEGNNSTQFAGIIGSISESDETDEAGTLELQVAESDGTNTAMTTGLKLEGEHATDGQIDVTIGAGAASDTTVAGNLVVTTDMSVDGTANLDNTDIDGTFTMDGTAFDVNATTTCAIDNSNTSNGVTIATATSGVPVSIGHTTSETTVNDNLTVTGEAIFNASAKVATAMNPGTADGATLGTTSLEWSDLYLADASNIFFGDNQEVVLTHVHNEGLTVTSANASPATGVEPALTLVSGIEAGSAILRFRPDQADDSEDTAIIGVQAGNHMQLSSSGLIMVDSAGGSATGGDFQIRHSGVTGFSFNADTSVASTTFTIHDDGNLANICSLVVGASGATSLITNDASGAAANLSIIPDGDVQFKPAGGNISFTKTGVSSQGLNINVAGAAASSGQVVISTQAAGQDIRFEADAGGGNCIMHIDDNDERVAIGGNLTTPTTTLDVKGSFRTEPVTLEATDAITAAEHAGRILFLGEPGGNADVVLTLPDATGTGNVYEFIVTVSMSSNTYKIACPDADNTITGQIQYLDEDGTGAQSFPTVSASDTITLNGGTQGGLVGDTLTLIDIAANKWMVKGLMRVAAGANPATPFSAAVS